MLSGKVCQDIFSLKLMTRLNLNCHSIDTWNPRQFVKFVFSHRGNISAMIPWTFQKALLASHPITHLLNVYEQSACVCDFHVNVWCCTWQEEKKNNFRCLLMKVSEQNGANYISSPAMNRRFASIARWIPIMRYRRWAEVPSGTMREKKKRKRSPREASIIKLFLSRGGKEVERRAKREHQKLHN